MLSLLVSLMPTMALAGQLICEDADQTARLTAQLPAGVTLSQPENNLKLDHVEIELDARYDWRDTGVTREAADGGAQWGERHGLIAVRGLVTNTLVSFRINSWNEKGEGIGRFENGAGNGSLEGVCRYEE